jgi:universal stress protein A
MKPTNKRNKPTEARRNATIELMPSTLEFRQILVPVDFSEPSRQMVQCAIQFAQRFDAKLTLLHVVEPLATPDFDAFPLAAEPAKVIRTVKARMELLCKQEGLQAPLLHDVQVREGKAFQVIVETARRSRMDLIIIATHGYTGLTHVLLGSTTERVVRHASCPVLVVRQESRRKT